MPLAAKRIAILARPEAQYAKDAIPTGAANAILVSNPSLTPMEADRAERDVVRPYFGNSESIPTGLRMKLEMEVEIAGAGAKGSAPAWGPLLLACGFAEKLTAGVKAEYTLLSDGFKSLSLYCNFDGVNHKLLGARGTLALDLKNKAIPKFKFTITGLYGGIADAALPSVVLNKFLTPVPFDLANVASLSLHGYSPAVESLSLDLANEVTHRALPGGSESVLITGRKPSGQLVMESVKVGEKDWWSAIRSASTGPLQLSHGKLDGNIVDINCPAIQLGDASYSESDGLLMLNAPLIPVPVAGDDELVITVR